MSQRRLNQSVLVLNAELIECSVVDVCAAAIRFSRGLLGSGVDNAVCVPIHCLKRRNYGSWSLPWLRRMHTILGCKQECQGCQLAFLFLESVLTAATPSSASTVSVGIA